MSRVPHVSRALQVTQEPKHAPRSGDADQAGWEAAHRAPQVSASPALSSEGGCRALLYASCSLLKDR